MDNPSSFLASGIPGACLLVAAQYIRTEWVRGMLLASGILLACFAVVMLFFWMRDQWIDQNRRMAEGKDRLFQLAEQVRYLSTDQIRFVQTAAHIGVDMTLEGETYLRGTNAPLSFVAEFLSKAYSRTTYPVRNYSEGTDEREWAQEITGALCAAGYALPAHGNEAALWCEGMGKEIIARKLGITLTANSPTPGNWTLIPGK